MGNNLNEMYRNLRHSNINNTQEVIDEIKTGDSDLDKVIKCYLMNSDKKNIDTSKFWSAKYIWGVSFADLSKLDLSEVSIEVLMRIAFSTETKWPEKDKLPKGFDPDKLIKKAKTFKGLGFEELHRKNIQGQGIKIAFIDKSFDLTHEEFSDSKIEYNAYNCFDKYGEYNFHGYSVASRIVGKNIGIAPKSEMVYYACGNSEKYSDYSTGYVAQVLKAVNDVVSRVENGEEISAIGMSSNVIGLIEVLQNPELKIKFQNRWNQLSRKLDELGIPVVDSSKFHKDFNYAVKFDPSKDNEDISNYYSSMVYSDHISVIEADKCVPMPYTQNGYKYENSIGCESWAIPQIIAMYALAKQTNPYLTYEEFVDMSRVTAQVNSNGTKLIDAVELIKEIKHRKEKESVFNLKN